MFFMAKTTKSDLWPKASFNISFSLLIFVFSIFVNLFTQFFFLCTDFEILTTSKNSICHFLTEISLSMHYLLLAINKIHAIYFYWSGINENTYRIITCCSWLSSPMTVKRWHRTDFLHGCSALMWRESTEF